MTDELHVKNVSELSSHVFLSFSHQDRSAAEALAGELRRSGIPVWVDYGKITPGTPDWENAIREGMERSLAVVVLASPHSRKSQYVRAEITLARAKNLSIYPLWISGTEWSDCVSLELIYTQYVDGRGEQKDVGVSRICSEIAELSAAKLPARILVDDAYSISTEGVTTEHRPAVPPAGYASALLDELPRGVTNGKTVIPGVFFRVSSYSFVGQLLNDIFVHYVHPKHEPLTYGKSWQLLGLGAFDVDRVLMPWQWLSDSGCSRQEFYLWAQSAALSNCGVYPDSIWCVGIRKPDPFVGISAPSQQILSAVRCNVKFALAAVSEKAFSAADITCPQTENEIREIVSKEAVWHSHWPEQLRKARAIKLNDLAMEKMKRFYPGFT